MSHPARFRPDDEFLAELRRICLALPQAQEKISHGAPNFYTRKVFAIFGAHVKGDHAASDYAQSMQFLPDPDERTALLDDERFFVPAYSGPGGWLGLNFRIGADSRTDVDWTEVAELIDMSYRNTASVTLVRQLDERGR